MATWRRFLLVSPCLEVLPDLSKLPNLREVHVTHASEACQRWKHEGFPALVAAAEPELAAHRTKQAERVAKERNAEAYY